MFYKKYGYGLAFALLLGMGNAWGQNDLFDKTHRHLYAEHLYNNGLYLWAIPEYLYLLQTDTTHTDALRLMQCYRFSNQSLNAKIWADTHFKNAPLPCPISNEYAICLAETGFYDTLFKAQFWAKSADTLSIKQLKISSLIFKKEYKQAQKLADTNTQFAPYKALATDGLRIRSKKVWVAKGLSMLLPGTGKIYAGQWKDGLITLATVGVMGWQAQRGFAAKGTRSIYGWITATMGLGYYLGGIYGAGRAARVHNEQLYKPIRNKTLQLLKEQIEIRP